MVGPANQYRANGDAATGYDFIAPRLDDLPVIAPELVLLANLAATLFMTGVIWYTQIVAYPLFPLVGTDRFSPYQAENVKRTAALVIPPMFVELGTTIWLVVSRPAAIPASWAWAGALLLALIWLSTFALQVPQHASLLRAFDLTLFGQLLRSNAIRTAGWTLRAALVLAMVWQLMR